MLIEGKIDHYVIKFNVGHGFVTHSNYVNGAPSNVQRLEMFLDQYKNTDSGIKSKTIIFKEHIEDMYIVTHWFFLDGLFDDFNRPVGSFDFFFITKIINLSSIFRFISELERDIVRKYNPMGFNFRSTTSDEIASYIKDRIEKFNKSAERISTSDKHLNGATVTTSHNGNSIKLITLVLLFVLIFLGLCFFASEYYLRINKENISSEVEKILNTIKEKEKDTSLDIKGKYFSADDINLKMNNISGLLNGMSTIVIETNAKVGDTNTKVGDINTKVGDINTKVGDINTKVGDINTKVGDINTFIIEKINTILDSIKIKKPIKGLVPNQKPPQ